MVATLNAFFDGYLLLSEAHRDLTDEVYRIAGGNMLDDNNHERDFLGSETFEDLQMQVHRVLDSLSRTVLGSRIQLGPEIRIDDSSFVVGRYSQEIQNRLEQHVVLLAQQTLQSYVSVKNMEIVEQNSRESVIREDSFQHRSKVSSDDLSTLLMSLQHNQSCEEDSPLGA